MSEAVRLVREFCDLMETRDAEKLRSFLADDAVYQNVGMPASFGVDDIVTNLAGQFGMFPDSYAYETINIVGDGDVVMTERLDLIGTPSGVKGVPVMGTFVLRDGKIIRWTDYFDISLPKKLMTGEDVESLIPAKY